MLCYCRWKYQIEWPVAIVFLAGILWGIEWIIYMLMMPTVHRGGDYSGYRPTERTALQEQKKNKQSYDSHVAA